jgi:hypothetical protein
VIKGAGFNFDKGLTLAENGIGDIIVPEDIKTAMPVKTKGFHVFAILLALRGAYGYIHPSIAKLHLGLFKSFKTEN